MLPFEGLAPGGAIGASLTVSAEPAENVSPIMITDACGGFSLVATSVAWMGPAG